MIKNFFENRKKIKRLKNNRLKIKINSFDLNFFDTNIFEFTDESKPLVSIIIPVYNQIKFTLNCLYSIYSNLDKNFKVEIIVINDNSIDDSLRYLEKIKGIRLVNNEKNEGFLLSINNGISIAKGEYVYLLNNDTEVQKDFLSSLLNVFSNKKDVGAVGSMLIYPNGRLQEAGCLIFDNCEIVNLGYLDVVENPHYNFLRKVDYCSGCSLLFKRVNSNGDLNLLDVSYAPAYYEETDLCSRLKFEQGLEIYYQPLSKIVHFENMSYSNGNTTKDKLIDKNRETFKNRWGDKYKTPRYYVSNNKNYTKLDKNYIKTILIFEQILPKYDLDSGSRRFTEMIKILVKHNYKIYLAFTDISLEFDEKYVKYFENLGVEIIRTFLDKKNRLNKEKVQLKEIAPITDFIWIFRPECFDHWYKKLDKYNFKSEVIYDMLDLHYLRLQRELEFLEPTEKRLKNIEKVKAQELNALNLSDRIIAISEKEKQEVVNLGYSANKINIISNIHEIKPLDKAITFNDREGILFIGGFKHTPNLDAVNYLYNDIMPIVWKRLPNLNVYIIGQCTEEQKIKFEDPRFFLLGYVEDVSKWFSKVKLSIAPLRYGAGVKGKIGQSLEYSLPVVTTDIGAEGMFLENEKTALIANTKEEFSDSIINLYSNETLWNLLSNNSEKALYPFSTEKMEKELVNILR
ncbi:glycosyltransferase [Apibacter raozihei]|uniref:glycosyltransferase n=1 Tax=Apibacter raozihei TaxID=2500547 RepID=UPI000FE35782|nr:glycosyltransferase [Apibacter raozihei]